MKYTPAPWVAQITSDPPCREFHIKSRDDRTVARYLSYDDHLKDKLTTALPAEVDPNARRIVACVNACEGINPEVVPDLLEALKDLYGLVESGDLVRDTSQDHEPDWTMRQLPFIVKLQAAQRAIAKATQEDK